MTMSWAGVALTATIIFLGILDLCFVLFTGAPSTISDFLIRCGFKAPMVVFAFGYISGHLFGAMKMEVAAADKSELDKICKEDEK